MKTNTDVTIVGAGPYGLSIASHLRARDVDFRIIGHPMHSWLNNMPKGMMLKSPGFASSLHDPSRSFTIRQYCQMHGVPYADIDAPIPLETFSAYGLAFQGRFVPELEEDTVTGIARHPIGFTVKLASGQRFTTRSVVLAIGLDHFRQMPAQLRRLPHGMASHSAANRDPAAFKDRKVAVIGGGSSATDLAVLLHEAGASVDLIVRKEVLDFGSPWLGDSEATSRSMWRKIREPLSGIGPGWRSRLCTDFPGLYRLLPDEFRLRTARTHLGPSGGWFMKQRATAVPTMLGHRLESASASRGAVHLQLLDAKGNKRQLSVEHVIAATGYFVDMKRLDLLDDELARRIDIVGTSPRLTAHFESSVPGLYFTGPIAAATFGPLMRFVAGAGFAANRITRRLARLPVTVEPQTPETSTVELET